jgi:hypothetical protein
VRHLTKQKHILFDICLRLKKIDQVCRGTNLSYLDSNHLIRCFFNFCLSDRYQKWFYKLSLTLNSIHLVKFFKYFRCFLLIHFLTTDRIISIECNLFWIISSMSVTNIVLSNKIHFCLYLVKSIFLLDSVIQENKCLLQF